MKTKIQFALLGALLISTMALAQEANKTFTIVKPATVSSDVNPNAVEGVAIFPNPSDGRFTIQLIGFTEGPVLQVYSLDKENVVFQCKLDPYKTMVNLTNVAKGIYVYRIFAPVDGNVVTTGKLTFK
jgi:hypothetical protein